MAAALVAIFVASAPPGVKAGSPSAASTISAAPEAPDEDGVLTKWWNGKKITGDWLGVRPAVEDFGLTLGGSWRGIFYGLVASETGSRGVFTQELVFNGKLDLAKLTKLEVLRGLSAFGEARWREPGYDANPNNFVEGASFFNPSRFAGGVGWRLGTFGLAYTTPELFGVEDFLTLHGGWLRPQREFLENEWGNLFANSSMAPAEGLGANIPFGASFSTWGGTIEVKPTDWQYTKLGLFMSYPEATSSNNNGLMFEGYAPDPAENGFFFMGETGVTPEIGPERLPGRYVFGGYYYEEDNATFGTSKYGFYWQAEQMLFREAAAAGGKLSDQGLHAFNLIVFAPDGWNNRYPFYFHSGLVYEGLIPGRDRDQLMAAVALGQHSLKTQQAAIDKGDPVPETTMFFEVGYRIKVSGWSYLQPFFQYESRPNGTEAVANAAILGFLVGVEF
jgi:carbohydrate-selective porin OprB